MSLTTTQIEKYADTLIWGLLTARKGDFKKYDTIIVNYDYLALELAEAIHRKLLKKRFYVIMQNTSSPTLEKDFYEHSDSKQRSFIHNGKKPLFAQLNGSIFLRAPQSLTHLKDIDPKRIAESAIAMKGLREIRNLREEQGKFGWTLCTYPTAALAKQAGMSQRKYEKQVIQACFLDLEDPVKKWKELFKEANKIKKWLNKMDIDTLRIESKNTDLEVKLGEQRRFMGVS